MASYYSQGSTSSSARSLVPCKWAYCTSQFEDSALLRAHIRGHVRRERMISTHELEIDSRDGQWYAREKESQGFGESHRMQGWIGIGWEGQGEKEGKGG